MAQPSDLKQECGLTNYVVCFHLYKIIHGVMHEPEGKKKNQLGPLLVFHFHIYWSCSLTITAL